MLVHKCNSIEKMFVRLCTCRTVPALSQTSSSINRACCTVRMLSLIDASLLITEKFNASSLSKLYSLNYSLSQAKMTEFFSIVLLECNEARHALNDIHKQRKMDTKELQVLHPYIHVYHFSIRCPDIYYF